MSNVHPTEQCYETINPQLNSFAYKKLGTCTDAEDLCQEAWKRFFSFLKNKYAEGLQFVQTVEDKTKRLIWQVLDPAAKENKPVIDNVLSFLRQILKNLIIAKWKDNAIRRSNSYEKDVDQINDIAEVSSDPIVRNRIEQEISKLPPRQRKCVVLLCICGYEPQEAAKILKISSAAVNQNMYNARKKLTTALQYAAAIALLFILPSMVMFGNKFGLLNNSVAVNKPQLESHTPDGKHGKGLGNAYIVGSTASSDFPTTNPIQSACGDAFVTKINTAEGALVYSYSTYLGGSDDEGNKSIVVDASGTVYTYDYNYGSVKRNKMSSSGRVTFLAGAWATSLTANGSQVCSPSNVSITINSQQAQNQASVVNAGDDQTITLPSTVNLTGTATDDGLPNPSGQLNIRWTIVGEPGSLLETTTTTGVYHFTYTATGANGYSDTHNDTIVVNCPNLTFRPGNLPNATVGTTYNQTITASGGVAPYIFTITAGSLSPGLVLSSGGGLSGTPTTAGNYTFTITATATDSNGNTGNSDNTLTLSPTSLPNATVGTPYSQTITATGGQAPYMFVITGLPSNLASLSIRFTDKYGTKSKWYVLEKIVDKQLWYTKYDTNEVKKTPETRLSPTQTTNVNQAQLFNEFLFLCLPPTTSYEKKSPRVTPIH